MQDLAARNLTEKDGVEQKAGIVPAQLFMKSYIHDATYFTGDITLETEQLNKARESDVKFLQSISTSTAKDFSSFRFLRVQALCNIAFGMEMLVHYGNKYQFQEWS